mmetsp:Transcript_13906/g.22703  ORF Transcript_13906/g.22703 Transcript_13906/m.22703 type:complete len:212 (+) Transcript_13906:59-694(+)
MASEMMTWLFGGFSLNVEEQLAFYGAYHSNPYNQIIHVVFVPIIWTTAAVWLAYTPTLYSGAPYWFNLSFIVYCIYAGFYFLLDFQTACIVNTVYFALFMGANRLVHAEKQEAIRNSKQGPQGKPSKNTRPSYRVAKWALVLHIFAWYMQIHPGHAILEGRKPALLDSFVQSLTLAPLFVFYEVIWFLVPGYQEEMQKNVQALILQAQANM